MCIFFYIYKYSCFSGARSTSAALIYDYDLVLLPTPSVLCKYVITNRSLRYCMSEVLVGAVSGCRTTYLLGGAVSGCRTTYLLVVLSVDAEPPTCWAHLVGLSVIASPWLASSRHGVDFDARTNSLTLLFVAPCCFDMGQFVSFLIYI